MFGPWDSLVGLVVVGRAERFIYAETSQKLAKGVA